MCKLKDENKEYSMSWSTASSASPFKCRSKRCNVCLTEKIVIVGVEERGLLKNVQS